MSHPDQEARTEIKVVHTELVVNRAYHESGTLQWVREAYKNFTEAGAQHALFTTEWQGVKLHGVHRRVIADDGPGVPYDRMVPYYGAIGGSAKELGGLHENFGQGIKTALLAWNPEGVVIISRCEGEVSMIWIRRYSDDAYGLRVFDTPEGPRDVLNLGLYEFMEEAGPYAGIDWSTVGAEFLAEHGDEHGTLIVLLGDNPKHDTILGDPTRKESDLKAIPLYLNQRVWDASIPTEVYVDEYRSNQRRAWPRSATETTDYTRRGQVPAKPNRRRIYGARYYIDGQQRLQHRSTVDIGKVVAHNTVDLPDGTAIDWWLWEGPRPDTHAVAPVDGFVGALYQGELYDVRDEPWVYRGFNVIGESVRKRLWLIARPPLASDADATLVGVYPQSARNALLIQGGGKYAGSQLPWATWGEEFARKMPQEIVAALKAAHVEAAPTDEAWRAKMLERYASRWKPAPRLRVVPTGKSHTDPDQQGTPYRVRIRNPQPPNPEPVAPVEPIEPGTARKPRTRKPKPVVIGERAGNEPAQRTKAAPNLPEVMWRPAIEFGKGMLASYTPRRPPLSPLVCINEAHPVILEQISHWQAQVGDLYIADAERIVKDVYARVAATRVAHSENAAAWLTDEGFANLHSEAALTMSLLGLYAEDTFIKPRILGMLPKAGKEAVE